MALYKPFYRRTTCHWKLAARKSNDREGSRDDSISSFDITDRHLTDPTKIPRPHSTFFRYPSRASNWAKNSLIVSGMTIWGRMTRHWFSNVSWKQSVTAPTWRPAGQSVSQWGKARRLKDGCVGQQAMMTKRSGDADGPRKKTIKRGPVCQLLYPTRGLPPFAMCSRESRHMLAVLLHGALHMLAKLFNKQFKNGKCNSDNESSKNDATTLSRMNFSGYVAHVTRPIFSWMLSIASCLVAGLGLDLVSGWLVVMNTCMCYFRLSLSHCFKTHHLRCSSNIMSSRIAVGYNAKTRNLAGVDHWVSLAKEWAELQARTNGIYGKIELDPIWTDERQRRTYGNGERYFLRKLWSSYGILTD